MDVCRILGPDAKDALPALTELLELPDSHHDVVVMTMERIGTDAVPYLASILPRLQGRPARLSVVMALGRMEPGKLRAHEEIVAPALVNCLADPDWNMRNHAYAALFAFSPEGKHTVPALLRLLRDKPLLSDLGDDAQDAIHRAQRHLDRLAPETRLEPVRADLD
jgi:HEAT repeat protein